MGAKRTNEFQLLTNVAVSGTNTYKSAIQGIQNYDNVGLQISWSGTPTGTITILASIDGVNFDALTFGTPLTQPFGSAGNILINLNQIPFPFLQIQYVNASGSGTLNAFLFSKDLN